MLRFADDSLLRAIERETFHQMMQQEDRAMVRGDGPAVHVAGLQPVQTTGPDPSVPTIAELAADLRTVQFTGWVVSPQAMRELEHYRYKHGSPTPEPSLASAFGDEVVVDDTLDGVTVLHVTDRAVWRAYLDWLDEPAARRRMWMARWRAEVEPGLILEADVRALIDRS